MKEIVFFLEEPSARAFLEAVLPRLISPEISPRYVVFDGKQDLERQLVKKLRGYINPNARFVIMRDQDSHPDCKQIKDGLLQKCQESGKAFLSIVRIACRELESFYLADLAAVESALEIKGLARHQNKASFRAPDQLGSPSKELKILTKDYYQKVSGSRKIGHLIDLQNTRSSSFKNLIAGIRRMETELMAIGA